MTNTSVCDVASDEDIKKVPNINLCRLWDEVGRHADPSRLTQVRERKVEPAGETEKQYLVVYEEMVRRKLPFV